MGRAARHVTRHLRRIVVAHKKVVTRVAIRTTLMIKKISINLNIKVIAHGKKIKHHKKIIKHHKKIIKHHKKIVKHHKKKVHHHKKKIHHHKKIKVIKHKVVRRKA